MRILGITLLSNTAPRRTRRQRVFYYLELHYSQTPAGTDRHLQRFSTTWNYTTLKRSMTMAAAEEGFLLLGITLLSNGKPIGVDARQVFYYLELHYSQTLWTLCHRASEFSTTWNYTTLKLCTTFPSFLHSFLLLGITLLSNVGQHLLD